MRRARRALNALLDEGHASEKAAALFHLGVGLAYVVMVGWHVNAAFRHRAAARQLARPETAQPSHPRT